LKVTNNAGKQQQKIPKFGLIFPATTEKKLLSPHLMLHCPIYMLPLSAENILF
jgi:hypothetical protein